MRLDILNNNERVLHGGVSNASHGCQLFIIKNFELFIKFIFSLKTCQIVFKWSPKNIIAFSHGCCLKINEE